MTKRQPSGDSTPYSGRFAHYETMSQHNFSARERVAHKLAGAAYQMTFVEDYDRAMATMASAIDFWEATRDEPLSDEEAASIYDLSPGDVTVELTGDGDREDRSIIDDAKAELDDDGPTLADSGVGGEPVDLHVPADGTKTRSIVGSMISAHADGASWVEPSDLLDYGASEAEKRQVAAVKDALDYVQWRQVDGQRANEYRIRPDVRAALDYQLGNGLADPAPA